MSSIFKVSLSLIVCLVLFARISAAETLRLGYIGALTGDAAALGSEIAKSLDLVVSEVNSSGGINGQKVELVIEDDGYQISRSISAYEKLKKSINSHVIFMTTYGALFALGERPARDGMVIVDTLDCNDDIVRTSAMHTCVASRTESIGENFLEAIKRRGGGSVGVLYEEEAWFNFIVSTLGQGHIGELVEVTAPVKAADYRGELLRLKNKAVKHIVFLGNDSMGRAMAQARAQGINAQFYSIAGVTSPGFQKLAGASLEGAVISNWLAPRNEAFQKFAEHFQTKYKRPVQLEFVAGPSADAAKLIFDTIKMLVSSGKDVTAENIRDELPQHEAFEGLSGTIKMDSDGAVRSIREKLYVYREGKLVDSESLGIVR